MPLTKEDHFDPSRGPKRILALDGGGIRGVLTLEYLDAIEGMIRDRSGRADALLCDYFDLIGGTSTGSIIAAALACGMSVAEIKDVYRKLGKGVFKKGKLPKLGLLAPKFGAKAVRAALDGSLGADTTLGGAKVRTGLMVMTKRLDTGSPWPLHNSPNGLYAAQDGKLLLSQIVRASTAAPTYFEPERVKISTRSAVAVDAAFVDGGVSPFNDPALQLLMVAALQGHGFRWQTGKDKLLLISVGTGTYKASTPTAKIMKMTAVQQALTALQSLMDDCARTNHGLLQWLTDTKTPWLIDRAVGDMQHDSRTGPQLATYARYNVLLKSDWLKANVKLVKTDDELEQIAQMDNPDNMDALAELGKAAAAEQIKPEHFPASFDI